MGCYAWMLARLVFHNICGVNLMNTFTMGETYTFQPIVNSVRKHSKSLVPDRTSGPLQDADVVFSGAINSSTFTYKDIKLSHQETNVVLNESITTKAISSVNFKITGLGAFTSEKGSYILTVTGDGIDDPTGKRLSGTATASWGNTPTGLIVVRILAPKLTNGSVTTVDVVFSAAINSSSFNYEDLTLTHNGVKAFLTSAITLSPLSATTYRVGGLGVFTALEGNYVVSVTGSGISDAFGRTGSGLVERLLE